MSRINLVDPNSATGASGELLGEITVLLVGVTPHRLAELLTRHMPLRLIIGIIGVELGLGAESHLLLGEAKRFEQKDVSVEVVSTIMPQEFGDRVSGVKHSGLGKVDARPCGRLVVSR